MPFDVVPRSCFHVGTHDEQQRAFQQQQRRWRRWRRRGGGVTNVVDEQFDVVVETWGCGLDWKESFVVHSSKHSEPNTAHHWLFQRLCQQLCQQLCQPRQFVRCHGSKSCIDQSNACLGQPCLLRVSSCCWWCWHCWWYWWCWWCWWCWHC